MAHVERDSTRKIALIFGNCHPASCTLLASVEHIAREIAVKEIRRRCFERCKGQCELCGDPVTWKSGELHEMVHKGRGGLVSVENSRFVCKPCHKGQHPEKSLQWSKKLA